LTTLILESQEDKGEVDNHHAIHLLLRDSSFVKNVTNCPFLNWRRNQKNFLRWDPGLDEYSNFKMLTSSGILYSMMSGNHSFPRHDFHIHWWPQLLGLWALRSAKFQPHPSSSSCYYYYIRKQKAENKLKGSDMVGFEY
jgi:hypothetical protein